MIYSFNIYLNGTSLSYCFISYGVYFIRRYIIYFHFFIKRTLLCISCSAKLYCNVLYRDRLSLSFHIIFLKRRLCFNKCTFIFKILSNILPEHLRNKLEIRDAPDIRKVSGIIRLFTG